MMTYTLIHNGTLIDGNGGDPIANGAVLVEDNRIIGVGILDSLEVPADAKRIDVGGGTIMPGLIDTHVHIAMEIDDMRVIMATPFSYKFYKSVDYFQSTINAGITTVRDAGGADLGMKQAIDQGVVVGPRLMLSITSLGITGGHTDGWQPSGMKVQFFANYPGMPGGICDGVEEVRKKVREILRAGAEVIKVCSTGGVLSPTDHPEFTQFTVEELAVMVQEGAYRKGIKVMAHAQGTEGVKNAVLAGIHSIEHGIYLDDEVIDLMLERGTFLVPTLLAPLSVGEIGEATGTMPEYGMRKAKEAIEAHKESITKAYKAGVKIAMGTDAGVMPHGTNLRELGLMCDIGMSPMESLVATTKMAAECLEWDDRIGTLEVGKLADITVSKTDPLADIRSLENNDNITLVVKDGQVLKNSL
jgi:imidazolonepropionase-like amidohydrolase